MRIVFAVFLLYILNSQVLACDLSQPDKIKHIKVSEKATRITKNIFMVPLLPLKPVKWIFNDKIRMIFPDNYLPQAAAGTVIFTAGVLKEVPIDLIWPGRRTEFCDIVADCRGIKQGLKKSPARKKENPQDNP